jgi:hypothetical protein
VEIRSGHNQQRSIRRIENTSIKMRKRPLKRLLKRLGAWWRRRNYRVVADPAKEYHAEARQPIMKTTKKQTIETSMIDLDETLVQPRKDLNVFPAPIAVQEPVPPPHAPPTKIPVLEAHPRDPQEERIAVPPPRSVDKPPLPEFLPLPSIPKTLPFPNKYLPEALSRRRTKDSFQGSLASLESIDSLVESYWDPEEDCSLATPIATNRLQSMDFLDEHVDFLRVQTQPRSVEVVWATTEGL